MKKQFNSHEEIKTFEEEKEIKNWLKEKYFFWKSGLTLPEKRAIENYTKDNHDNYNSKLIGEYLNTFKGVLIKKEDPQFEKFSKKFGNKIEEMNDTIQKIDFALQRKNAKVPETVLLYHQPLKQKALEEMFVDKKTGKINELSVREYKEKRIKNLNISHDYLVGSLSKKSIDKNHYVFYEFKVPKNSQSGYLYSKEKESKLIIPRNHEYIINDVEIVNMSGKQIIKVSAELLPNPDYDHF